MSRPHPGRDHELVLMQTLIAKRWLKKGKAISDLHAKFIFFFTGLNALYFVWYDTEREEFRKRFGKSRGEGLQIRYLISKLDVEECASILDRLEQEVTYFCRRHPIERMGDREPDPSRGDEREGLKLKQSLVELGDPVERVSALAQILYLVRCNLYLVRCNLIHGSKAGLGDDDEVIGMSARPMQLILESTLRMSEAEGRN